MKFLPLIQTLLIIEVSGEFGKSGEGEKCYEQKADIMFALDESSSIRFNSDFLKEVDFVKKVKDKVNIGPNEVRIGVLTFSDEPRLKIGLGGYDSEDELNTKLEAINLRKGGKTQTGDALEMVMKEFQAKEKDREENVPQICVFITDGESTNETATNIAVKQIKSKTRIIMFAIGVGSKYSEKELKKMVTSPERMFGVDDFGKLELITEEIVKKICAVEEEEKEQGDQGVVDDNEKEKEDEGKKCDGKKDEEPQKTEECKISKADILILLDGSTSIRNEKVFQKELDFLKELIDNMNIGEDKTKIGVIQFATTAQLEFGLSEFSDKKTMGEAVDQIKWMRGNTYLHDALQLAMDITDKGKALRHDVPHILVVITDGKATMPSETREKVKIIKEETDFQVVTLGIGIELSPDDLAEIASEPKETHVFKVDSQDALPSIRQKLLTVLCQADVPAEQVCATKKADIIFVTDFSSSIGYTGFAQLISFIQKVIDKFTIGIDHIQIGLISFSTTAKTEFSLNEYREKDKLQKEVGNLKYTTGDTNTHLAIKRLEDEFELSGRSDADVAQTVIVITDGDARNPTETEKAVKEAKERGVTMFAIGVGPYFKIAELKKLASGEKQFFMVNDYAALDSITNSLASRTCQAEKLTPKRRFDTAKIKMNDRKDTLGNRLMQLGSRNSKNYKDMTAEERLLVLLKKALEESREK